MRNSLTSSLSAVLLALSTSALAGGGGPIIHSPDFADFAGYECINDTSFRRQGYADIILRAPTQLKLFEDTITAKLGTCKISLTVSWDEAKDDEILDSLAILDAESNCESGVEKISHIFPVGTSVHRGWFAKSGENILGIAMDKLSFPKACTHDASPYATFLYR